MSFLDELNEIQYQAVTNTKGPIMIIAGPGSGKTRVLTYRIAHILAQGTDAFRVLALTFTNKAATEMRERIEKIVGTEARNLYMGTFHAVFARILRVEAEKIGYPRNFTIYDTDDAKSLLKSIIKEEGLNDKLYKASTIYYRISNAKNNLMTAEDYLQNETFLEEDKAAGRPKTAELYAKYTFRCFKAGALDFDDLLLKTHQLLQNFPDVLYKYQNRFQYLMIDEFQDTNFAQYEIVRKIAAINENICVVGDDAQSIYAFRGATIDNILNFEKDYPDLKVFKLEQNYRSTEHIVKAANDVIVNNQAQLKKEIWTEKLGGEKIKVYRTISDAEEAKMIANAIFEQKAIHHIHNAEIAILYRTNAQSRSFEESLRRLNIPYKIYGGTSFYQRKEIKDFIAYLRLVINPNDEESLKRIINFPTRGIGQTSIDRMIVAANEHNISLWQVVEHPDVIQDIQARAKNLIKNFSIMMKSFRIMLKDKNAYEIAAYIGKTTGLIDEYFKDKTIEGISKYENIQELLNGIKEYTESEKPTYEEDEVKPENDLAAYLQQISLLTDQDDQNVEIKDRIKLMTVHAAKGLEFESVFVVGLEEMLFPSALSIYTREDLEEERRLFYVAITRAKKILSLSYALTRYKFGQLNHCEPSRFISEIKSENLIYFGQKQNNTNTPKQTYDLQKEPKWYLNKVQENNKKAIEIHPAKENLTKIQIAKNTTDKQNSEYQNKNLIVGSKVMHERFNIGKVIQIEGNDNNKIATIFFQDFGNKKIMLKFAKLQVIE